MRLRAVIAAVSCSLRRAGGVRAGARDRAAVRSLVFAVDIGAHGRAGTLGRPHAARRDTRSPPHRGAANSAEGRCRHWGRPRRRGHITASRTRDALRRRGEQRRRRDLRAGRRALPRPLAQQRARPDQTGSVITDKIIRSPTSASAAHPVGNVRASGQPAPEPELASYSGGQWYDAAVTPDGTGTYNIVDVQAIPGVTLTGRRASCTSARARPVQRSQHPGLGVLRGEVAAYAVDARAIPDRHPARLHQQPLRRRGRVRRPGHPATVLFSTFGGGNRVIVVRGFARPLPPPVVGKKVNVLPARGTVKIRRPGASSFKRLRAGQQLPVGTSVDVTKGKVTLVAAANRKGATMQGGFYDGTFKVRQTKGAKPLTKLALTDRLSCGSGAANAAAKRRKRRLWGDGSGRFRTAARTRPRPCAARAGSSRTPARRRPPASSAAP